MVGFDLPLPPSINAMYGRSGHSFYKKKAAKDWIAECTPLVKKKTPYKSKVDVIIWFYFKRDSDIDNRVKALLDLLEECQVYENDRQVYSLNILKIIDKENPRVRVEVYGNAD